MADASGPAGDSVVAAQVAVGVDGPGVAGPPTAVVPSIAIEDEAPAFVPGAASDADGYRLLNLLERLPHAFDFFQILRRLEGAFSDRPRLGESTRPAQDPIRLGQEPSMAFAPGALAGVRPGKAGGPPWLMVHFLGLLGPNGPLPFHWTEYTRDRLRNSGDATMARFMDLFHHRMLSLFYRAWANSQPTVSHDRPDSDRFRTYVGAITGMALRSLQGRDEFADSARFFYSGLLGAHARNAAGLGALIGDFFGMPARIEEFVGDWLDLPLPSRWALGRREPANLLGLSTTLGARVWTRQHRFRVVLGPLDRGQFQRMLPGGESLPRLRDAVRAYIGDEFRWDVRLTLHERVEHPMSLGVSRLGWNAWLGRTVGERREDLILDPQSETVSAAS